MATLTHCFICNRELQDANSVERGIGPICAEKMGIPADSAGPGSEINRLVHGVAVLAAGRRDFDALARALRDIVAAGYPRTARLLSSHLTEVRDAYSGINTITITKDGPQHVQISAPFSSAAIDAWRQIPGRTFLGSVKRNRIPLAQLPKLWALLERCYRLATVQHSWGEPFVVGLDTPPAVDIPEPLPGPPKDTAPAHVYPELPSCLYDYQRDGIAWLRSRDRAGLFDDMGLGKTVQLLLSIPLGYGATVVCPAAVKGVWAGEAAKWRKDLLRVTVLSGRGSYRAPEPGELVITNYELLPASPEEWDEFAKVERAKRVLIADEGHLLKNYKAKRTDAFRFLAHSTEIVYLATGTPMLGKPLDLWGVLSSAGISWKVFSNWKGFLAAFNGRKGPYGLTFGRPEPTVKDRLARHSLRRTKAEVLPELPPITSSIVTVDCPKKLERELSTIEIDPNTIPSFRGYSALRAQLAEIKTATMLELVEAHQEQETPVLVFSAHRSPIDALASAGHPTITGDTSPEERTRIVADFQAGKVPVLGLTIKAGGVGITLTHASHVIMVDRELTPALNAQAIDRCRRIGQRANNITVTELVIDHALDRDVARLLREKEALIMATGLGEAAPAPAPAVEETPEYERTGLDHDLSRLDAV